MRYLAYLILATMLGCCTHQNYRRMQVSGVYVDHVHNTYVSGYYHGYLTCRDCETLVGTWDNSRMAWAEVDSDRR